MDLATIMLADPGASAEQEQLLSDLMISVIERFTPWRTLSQNRLETGRNRDSFDWRIRRAVNLIRTTPQIARDVETLAREVGLSRAHFYRLFERSTRMTPHLYLNLLRMELAVNSVVHTDDTLSTVSESLGFSAPGHFTRFFRDHAGTSPSEFRHVARMGLTASA
jgi:transcriptional regulator GlxA family with amidase domain